MALPLGGGRYEKETTAIVMEHGAAACLTIVVHADPAKCGFSIACINRAALHILPDTLRDVASQMEQDLKEFPDRSTTHGRDATTESKPTEEG